MSRESRGPYLLIDRGTRVQLFFLLGALLALLSGCSTTGGKDSAPSDLPELADIADAVPKMEPKSKYGNPKSYVVFGRRYYTKASSKGHVERGLASWYGKKFHGRKTSSGERYDMYAMTAAHKTLPLPTYAQVTNVSNGRSAVVKINDRGPFHGKRVIDLSYSAARKLGVVAKGTAMVEVRAIDPSRPGTSQQNGFLASADSAFDAKTAAPKKAVVARKVQPAKRAVPQPMETATRVAKAEKRLKQPKNVAVPAGKEAEPSAPEPKVAVASTQDKPKQSADSSTYLQVGAFGSRSNAEQLKRRLVSHIAEQVQVRAIDNKQVPLYKVHVGPFDSRERAKDLSQQLASLGVEGSHIVVE